jgi:hypothetical protein
MNKVNCIFFYYELNLWINCRVIRCKIAYFHETGLNKLNGYQNENDIKKGKH